MADLQVICRMGHIGFVDDVQEPEEELLAFIAPCQLCGARANWRKNRPPIITIRRGNMTPDYFDPRQA